MSIESDTQTYERWLRRQCDVVESDLEYKHKRMKKSAFVFLRATYYRWAKKIEAWCPELTKAPRVAAVGDIHTENFGTWRDSEGRLVWGINDFDEAARMPYVHDLVRLATSASLAAEGKIATGDICAAMHEGYARGLASPGPTLLDEQAVWMRQYVGCSDDERRDFWRDIEDCPQVEPPRRAARGLRRCLPDRVKILRFCVRTKRGGGGLGRPRYAVVAAWRGGRIVREAKAVVSSAWHWAHRSDPDAALSWDMATGRYRATDPFFRTDGYFVYRRIAADSRKVELGDDAGRQLKLDLVEAMAFDLAAVHAAAPRHRRAIAEDIRGRRAGWLESATDRAAAATRRDYDRWHEAAA